MTLIRLKSFEALADILIAGSSVFFSSTGAFSLCSLSFLNSSGFTQFWTQGQKHNRTNTLNFILVELSQTKSY